MTYGDGMAFADDLMNIEALREEAFPGHDDGRSLNACTASIMNKGLIESKNVLAELRPLTNL